MASKIYLICLCMFFCIIQSSFALKCFTCNSESFSKCSDLSDNTLQSQECSVESYLSRDGTLLDHLGFGGKINSANKDTITPTCLKFTSSNPKNGEKGVIRLCTFKLQNQDTCALARTKLAKTPDDVIEFCGTCDDKDGCNTGSQIKLFYLLFVLATMVSTARLFI